MNCYKENSLYVLHQKDVFSCQLDSKKENNSWKPNAPLFT